MVLWSSSPSYNLFSLTTRKSESFRRSHNLLFASISWGGTGAEPAEKSNQFSHHLSVRSIDRNLGEEFLP